MIFTTWLYAFFLSTVFTLYWLAPARARPHVLIAGGLLFYANYFPPHVVIVLALTVFTFVTGTLIRRQLGSRKSGTLSVGLIVTVGALAYYKYANFLFDSYDHLRSLFVAVTPSPAGALRAPLAISFFTFEFVHYLVEVYRGNVTATFRNFLVFILFFPTLIAGPIKRYQNFSKYLDFSAPLDWGNIQDALQRILFGLSKKILIADTVASLTAPVWHDPLSHSTGTLWLASYGYAVQIYMDFSGYSDLAIGSAKLLGFKVEENFNWPYLRSNIREFWRSWHMSLTSWITDYVYIPLGGNRGGPRRAVVNTMIAMALCGLWHGAAFHFVLWGAYHGAALCFYRMYAALRDRRLNGRNVPLPGIRRVVATVFTFHVVVVGWVFFIVDSVTATRVIGRMLLPFAY